MLKNLVNGAEIISVVICKKISLTQLLNFKFHFIQLGCGLTDGLVEDTILLLHIFESSFSTNLAPLTQG